MSRKRTPCSETGFTLLEIMIVIALIGGLLGGLIYTLNYHLSVAESQEFFTVASLLAREKMAEMEKQPVSGRGEFPEPYSGYQYETTIKESPYPNLSEISVTVSNGKREVVFVELIAYRK